MSSLEPLKMQMYLALHKIADHTWALYMMALRGTMLSVQGIATEQMMVGAMEHYSIIILLPIAVCITDNSSMGHGETPVNCSIQKTTQTIR